MKELVPVYRLRKGRLVYNDFEVAFPFGIVYSDEGQYFFELFLDEDIPLSNVFNANRDTFMRALLSLEATTESGEQFFATEIFPNKIEPGISKITAECLDRITIEKVKEHDPRKLKEQKEEPILFFIKLEGLKMCFSDHTQVKAYRNHQEISWHLLQDYNWDHSVCTMQIGYNSYKMIFKKHVDGEIIVEFLSPEAQYRSMRINLWNLVKADFISVLSFLNGAPVQVRTEYTGSYYSQLNLDAQVKHIYSFKKELARGHSDFIPLNDEFQKGTNIVNRVLFWDFNRYRYWNRKLDLNNIVHILGNAEQVRGLHERVFIQMILLERLSDSYALIQPIQNPKLVDEKTFTEIRNELEAVLKSFEHELNPNHYQTIKARLFGLNDGKRRRTDVKIVSMLEDIGIDITTEIRQVISEDRHAIIHKGTIGSGRTFDVLDKLLRQIVINLMKYTGPTAIMGRGAGGSTPIFESYETYMIDDTN
jgi:hypothetical protein